MNNELKKRLRDICYQDAVHYDSENEERDISNLIDKLIIATCNIRGCEPSFVPAKKSEMDRKRNIISTPLVAGPCIWCGENK